MKARILLDWIAAAVSLAAIFVVLAILFQARALPITIVVPGEGNAGPLIPAGISPSNIAKSGHGE